jgi:hypothetical protein
MKDPRHDLRAAMQAAEELSMFEDRHYKLAAERVVGRAVASADNLALEKVRGRAQS